jgi:uncharacterized protein (TIGR01777 family)
MKVLLPGGTGFLGRVLARHFLRRGWEVVVLARGSRPSAPGPRVVEWDGHSVGVWAAELEGCDLVVNLCGRSVNCRYTPENRREILASRLDSTRVLGEAISACRRPPPLWINSSSATIYRHAEDREMTEAGGEIGSGFSVEVCQNWEVELFKVLAPHTRKIAMRSAMVLGRDPGSVFQVLSRLVRLGLGGRMGAGRQYVSWLHEADFCGIVDWLVEQESLVGPINVCAPEPVPNWELMRTLRRAWGVPAGLPATRLMLEVGAWFLGTETELILKSRRVVPGRLLDSGYGFCFPRIGEAVQDLCARG